MIPGEYILAKGDIECNAGATVVKIKATNTGDRPIQVGSHYHFFEVNKAVEFDREKAYGMRLNIISGTAVRFEPGEEKSIELVPYGGSKRIVGFNNLVDGYSGSSSAKTSAMAKVKSLNYKNKKS
jgi:urease subunit beta